MKTFGEKLLRSTSPSDHEWNVMSTHSAGYVLNFLYAIFILFIYLLFLTGPQGQQCYTLMGFSILYKNSLLLLLLLLLLSIQFYSSHSGKKKSSRAWQKGLGESIYFYGKNE